MTRTGWAFVGGFVLAAAMSIGIGLYRDAKAAAARVQLEDRLAAGARALELARADLDQARARAARLAADSNRLAADLALSREAVDAGLVAVRELARIRRAAGDTGAATALEGAAGAVEAERRSCSLVVLNCEQRASNATAAWHLAESQLDSTAADLVTTAARWRDAERRAQPSFFRDIWRARGVTLPLLAATVFFAARR